MGKFIEWKPELSVSCTALDEQHKQVIGIINDLFEAMAGKRTGEMLPRLLQRLRIFTQTHFGYEEVLMDAVGHGDLEAHRKLHADMMRRTLQIIDDLEANRASAQQLLLVLREWWLNHICVVDRAYIPLVAKLEL